jgi:hypothetical protein
MDVEIEDGDPLHAVLSPGRGARHGDVVDQAETAGHVGRGVMAGRADRREGRRTLPSITASTPPPPRPAARWIGLGAALAHHGVAVDLDVSPGPGWMPRIAST